MVIEMAKTVIFSNRRIKHKCGQSRDRSLALREFFYITDVDAFRNEGSSQSTGSQILRFFSVGDGGNV